MPLLPASMLVGAGPAFAQAPSGKVTVVTSFSKDVTDPIKKAFEKANPGLTLEVQNRNTNAGVKFVEETRSNPQSDLFWASAPDAFEVLKTKKLLQKYDLKVRVFRRRSALTRSTIRMVLFRLRGLGLWHHVERALFAREPHPEPKEWSDLAKPVYHDHVSIASPARSGTTHLTLETILQARAGKRAGPPSRPWPATSTPSPSVRSACRMR